MTRKNTIIIPERLKPFVRAVWYIDGSVDNAFPNYADGTPGVVFQQRDTGIFACENPAKIPGGYVFGQTIKPVILNAPKNCIIIGVALYPHVLQSIFRFNASEITDNFVDLSLLPDRPSMDPTHQLWDTADPQMQLGVIFRYLEALIEKNGAAPDKGLQYAVSRIFQGKEGISFKKIHTDLNVSERTFQRKFEQHVGISPRLLANIAQFQAALKQLKGGKYTHLSDIAYENGYADQSHFIRAFKRFTGSSPLQFIKQCRGGDEMGMPASL